MGEIHDDMALTLFGISDKLKTVELVDEKRASCYLMQSIVSDYRLIKSIQKYLTNGK